MPRLAKGSKEAAERMAHLRSLRKKKGGSIEPSTPLAETPVVSEAKEGKGAKSSGVKHVADFAHKNNMNYFEALKDPKVKLGYKKM